LCGANQLTLNTTTRCQQNSVANFLLNYHEDERFSLLPLIRPQMCLIPSPDHIFSESHHHFYMSINSHF